MTNWRRQKKLLVTEAHAIGSVAVIRSLGRAGYHVIACSSRPHALGSSSRFAAESVQCPSYDDATFLPWFDEFVRSSGVDAVIPSEGLLLALMPALDSHGHLLPCSTDAAVLRLCLSKYDLFKSFTNAGAPAALCQNLPKYRLIDCEGEMPCAEELLASLGSPVYIKTDAVHARRAALPGVHCVASPEDTQRRIVDSWKEYRHLSIQGHAGGVGVGAFLLVWDGKVIARFMHRRLHEVPHTGGVSSYRRSWWDPVIYDDALARMNYLGWNGVCMLEYRWDPTTQRFCLIEINSRFWGSLHLALFAGVDFPTMLMDGFFGRPVSPVLAFPSSVHSRMTVPNEIEYVWSRLKDKSLPLVSRLWSVLELFLLGVNPRVKSDLLFPGDRGLYWIRLKQFVAENLHSAIRRLQ
jgi:hypothetical protein